MSAPPSPLIRCLLETLAVLERARREGDLHQVDEAIDRLNSELARERNAGRPGWPIKRKAPRPGIEAEPRGREVRANRPTGDALQTVHAAVERPD